MDPYAPFDHKRIHPRYKYAFTGNSTWRGALIAALDIAEWPVERGSTYIKPIVYKSRSDGFWWATWSTWQKD
jgi:hypothetical protein